MVSKDLLNIWLVNRGGQSRFTEYMVSKYRCSVKISTIIETVYLKGLLLRKGIAASLDNLWDFFVIYIL